ncbi:MAG: DUF1266 domain-containing protein [Sedimentisphaerales bacterium]
MKRLSFLIFCLLCVRSYAEINPDPNQNSKPNKLSNAQRWALGASGMLASSNHMKFDSLAGYEVNKFAIKSEKKLLEKWWGVTDRKSLLESLKWLEEGGHSADFEELAVSLNAPEMIGPTLVRAEFEDKLKTNEELRGKVAVVSRYYEKLGDKSLQGWDGTRYICLCRWGFICGYITEAEAWEKIMPAARHLQQTFNSWEELCKNYLIGREYWSPNDEDHYIYEDTYVRLLEMPESPCKKLPWDLPLYDINMDPNNIEDSNKISTGVSAANFSHYKEGGR